MTNINEKYVKQTYEVMSNSNTNLEAVAMQISQLPAREQAKYFRLLLNYVDITATKISMHYPPVGLSEIITLCNKVIKTVNDHYEEKGM
jgi:hypothetical protein